MAHFAVHYLVRDNISQLRTSVETDVLLPVLGVAFEPERANEDHPGNDDKFSVTVHDQKIRKIFELTSDGEKNK